MNDSMRASVSAKVTSSTRMPSRCMPLFLSPVSDVMAHSRERTKHPERKPARRFTALHGVVRRLINAVPRRAVRAVVEGGGQQGEHAFLTATHPSTARRSFDFTAFRFTRDADLPPRSEPTSLHYGATC